MAIIRWRGKHVFPAGGLQIANGTATPFVVNGAAATPAMTTVTLVSGTATKDATGTKTVWYLQFTGSGTGTAAVAIGPTAGVANAIIPAFEVPATVGATVAVELPANWYIKATVTGGVAIVASTPVVTG